MIISSDLVNQMKKKIETRIPEVFIFTVENVRILSIKSIHRVSINEFKKIRAHRSVVQFQNFGHILFVNKLFYEQIIHRRLVLNVVADLDVNHYTFSFSDGFSRIIKGNGINTNITTVF